MTTHCHLNGRIRCRKQAFDSILSEEQGRTNPMCYAFPRIASCEYYRFGSAGGQEKINALCILGLNLINDKVENWCTYLILIFV